MLRSRNSVRTEPSTEPVSVAELKLHARIEHSEDDVLLASIITAARREAEEIHLNKLLINQTCVDYFDGFAGEMELFWAPVATDGVASVRYLDSAGTWQTVSSSVYDISRQSGACIIRPAYGQSWPTPRDSNNCVEITYTAGYGPAASSVPAAIRLWIKVRATWLYENKDGSQPWHKAIDSLLGHHAISRVVSGST